MRIKIKETEVFSSKIEGKIKAGLTEAYSAPEIYRMESSDVFKAVPVIYDNTGKEINPERERVSKYCLNDIEKFRKEEIGTFYNDINGEKTKFNEFKACTYNDLSQPDSISEFEEGYLDFLSVHMLARVKSMIDFRFNILDNDYCKTEYFKNSFGFTPLSIRDGLILDNGELYPIYKFYLEEGYTEVPESVSLKIRGFRIPLRKTIISTGAIFTLPEYLLNAENYKKIQLIMQGEGYIEVSPKNPSEGKNYHCLVQESPIEITTSENTLHTFNLNKLNF